MSQVPPQPLKVGTMELAVTTAVPAPGGFGHAQLGIRDPHMPPHAVALVSPTVKTWLCKSNESKGEDKSPDHHQTNTINENLVSKIFCERLY